MDSFQAEVPISVTPAARNVANEPFFLTGSYRAPNDYEARQSLTVRLLATRERRVFREAVGSYRVTHLALDDAYLEPLEFHLIQKFFYHEFLWH